MMPDWRNEVDQAKTQVGSYGALFVYWLVTTVVLFGLSVAFGGVSDPLGMVINVFITMIAAVPFALGLGWLTARNKQ